VKTAEQTTEEPRRLADWLPDGPGLPPEESLDRFLGWVAARGIEPYAAQEEALLELWANRHVVLQTPTGSGKSLVALGLHFKALCEGKRSFYTAPIKALASEKFFALCDELGARNVGMLTGDASINWSAPVICCTAEVLANMTLRQGEATDAPYVVMDEFHFYGDAARGVAWQIPLLQLPHSTFLLMSATLGNTAAIEERLAGATGRAAAHVFSSDRPVPLDFEYRETPIHETVEALLEQQRAPIYIVHFTQRQAAEQAQALTSARVATSEARRAIAEAVRDFRFDSPFGKTVARLVRHGVGLHHAGLLPKYRLLVEQLAQRGWLRVVCGTDTLGVGVNIPIRTVLFSGLSKFDGEKVGILSVREFKQIAGRAGRKGFDERGSVVCQAPEHVIENRRAAERAAKTKDGGRPAKRSTKGSSKGGAKRRPPRGFVNWSEETFERLIHQPPEQLVSRFRVSHGMVIQLLQCGEEQGVLGGGYRLLFGLIERSHERPGQKRHHRREAARIFRSLREAGVIEIVAVEPQAKRRGRRVRVAGDLQREFSLHQALSLYLVDAVSLLDPDDPDYARDVLSLVEAILENPRAILLRQIDVAKRNLIAELKAQGVPYEERIERLDEVTHPKPQAALIYESFALFAERHPWVEQQNVHPKSIAREMWEHYEDFSDYVRRYGLERSEGLLLRYLGQVHNTAVQSVPEYARDDELVDAIGFFRAMLGRVDSSLTEEWERLLEPDAERAEVPAAKLGLPPPPRRVDLARDRRALLARVRAEFHQVVRALASKDYEGAAQAVRAEPDEPWDASRFEEALALFFEEYEVLRFDPQARQGEYTVLHPLAERRFRVHQTLLDARGDFFWEIEAEVDLREERDPAEPLLRIRRVGP